MDTKKKNLNLPMNVYLNNESIECTLDNYINLYTNGEVNKEM